MMRLLFIIGSQTYYDYYTKKYIYKCFHDCFVK